MVGRIGDGRGTQGRSAAGRVQVVMGEMGMQWRESMKEDVPWISSTGDRQEMVGLDDPAGCFDGYRWGK